MSTSTEQGPRLKRGNPCFLVDDVFASAEYYRDVLGFHFDQFWGEPPRFVMVLRDRIQIMLRQPETAADGSIMRPNRSVVPWALDAYIYVEDVDGLHAEFAGRGAEVLSEPCDQPHDCREFELRDCNGYVLCFGENLLSSKR